MTREAWYQLKIPALQAWRVALLQRLPYLSSVLFLGGEDDQFFSLMSPGRGGSDMESSISSNLSGVSTRTSSTTTTCEWKPAFAYIQYIHKTLQTAEM